MLPPQLLLSLPDSLTSGFLQASRDFSFGLYPVVASADKRGLWQYSNDQMPTADELYVQGCKMR